MQRLIVAEEKGNAGRLAAVLAGLNVAPLVLADVDVKEPLPDAGPLERAEFAFARTRHVCPVGWVVAAEADGRGLVLISPLNRQFSFEGADAFVDARRFLAERLSYM